MSFSQITGRPDSFISFEEIAQGKTVRMTRIDSEWYISCIDFVMVMTDKDANDSAQVMRRLPDYVKEDLEEYIKKHQFSGDIYIYI